MNFLHECTKINPFFFKRQVGIKVSFNIHDLHVFLIINHLKQTGIKWSGMPYICISLLPLYLHVP